MGDDEELPALVPYGPEDADPEEWQKLLAERERQLSVRPSQSQQQALGAPAYDRAAAELAAARSQGSAVRMSAPSPPMPGQWNGESYLGAQQAAQEALPGVQLPSPSSGAAPQAAAPDDDYRAALAALQARIEQNQRMQEQSLEAAFERSRPSESEKWLGIAAALASPTRHGSFGETMGNVFQALIQHKQGTRQAESTRQSELARLRQAYDLASINAMARGLKPPTAASLAFDPLGQARRKDTGELAADAKGRPVVRTDADFLRLSPGQEFVDVNGNIRRKPGG